ncbi:MAG: DciA family protein [Alphaproteobacteria bacterium]|nr:DciA family protein [Alphaproteobacteria bacterium]
MFYKESTLKVSDIATNLIKNSVKESKYMELFSRWQEIVGQPFADLTTPHKITGNNPKILIIKAKKGYALQILHESMRILNAVNSFLQSPIFSQIKVIQADEIQLPE